MTNQRGHETSGRRLSGSIDPDEQGVSVQDGAYRHSSSDTGRVQAQLGGKGPNRNGVERGRRTRRTTEGAKSGCPVAGLAGPGVGESCTIK